MGPTPEAVKKLKSKRFDYNGQPVDHMLDLDAEKIVRAWPAPGSVGQLGGLPPQCPEGGNPEPGGLPPPRDRAAGETPRLTGSSL